MPNRRLFRPPSRVLIVSGVEAARESLKRASLECLPGTTVEAVASFPDAALRLARGDVQLVVLDLRSLPPLSGAARMMLRGLAPQAQLLALPPGSDESDLRRLVEAVVPAGAPSALPHQPA